MTPADGGSTFDGSTAEGSFLARMPAGAPAPRLAATLICHPELGRVGERAWLGSAPGRHPVFLSRLVPRFAKQGGAAAGAPLGDRFLSREALRLTWLATGLEIDPAACPHPLRLDGHQLAGRLLVDTGRLESGVVLEIADRVALLLHLLAGAAEPAETWGLAGESAAIAGLRHQIARVGPTPWPALLRGETGSGKELVARALHQTSGRRGPFLALNMAALPGELAAAELFGARRGAFTGAAEGRRGLCAAAEGGTLFLDEIGEASLDLQAMLLRALETGEILPLGADKPVKIDVRFVAATDADLDQAIAEGRFRAPLKHRLAGLEIAVPPLRRRRDDVVRLLLHFLAAELEQLGKSPPAAPFLTPSLAARLTLYPWPGNVRELRNLARRWAAFGPDEAPELGDSGAAAALAGATLAGLASGPARPAAPDPRPAPAGGPGRQEVLAALAAHGYEIKSAAGALGLSRNALYGLLERFGLPSGGGGLELEQIEEALKRNGGDLVAAARALGVSVRALRRRHSELRTGA